MLLLLLLVVVKFRAEAFLKTSIASAFLPCDTSHLADSGTSVHPMIRAKIHGNVQSATKVLQLLVEEPPPPPSPPSVILATTTTYKQPIVQKYSMTSNFDPRPSAGKNSALIGEEN